MALSETWDDAGIAGAMTHDEAFGIAERLLPGACLGGHALPPDLRFAVHKAAGSRIQDLRGRWYIDYVCGAGPLILGHAHPDVVAGVQAAAADGIHYFGMPNALCLQLADAIAAAVPCAEKLAFTSTGSESTFYAIRFARAFTGRDKILKFEGAYHGNHDYAQISYAPSALSNYPAGRPDTGGIPASVQGTVLIAPYNDLDVVRRLVAEHRADLAAIIVEPVQRIIAPDPDFLPGLRRICDENDVLLIFDEVVTGFRLAYGGGQEIYGVRPDLATYGKIVGGGAALGCVAGRAEIIDLADPANKANPDYAVVLGTTHGGPLAAAAGLANLAYLRQPGVYERLNAYGDDTRRAFQQVLDRHRLPARCLGEGSMWQIMFLDKPPRNHGDVLASDQARAKKLDAECLRRGAYVLPGGRRFVSVVHTDTDLEDAVRALDEACRTVA